MFTWDPEKTISDPIRFRIRIIQLNHCCGSEKKFRIRTRIQIGPEVSFGFESGSESGYSDLDHQLEKTFVFFLKFLPCLIFKNKKAAFPQLLDLARNKLCICRIRIWIH